MEMNSKNPNKLVTLNDDTNGGMVRAPRSMALQMIALGTHSYSSKGRLKSFKNREVKIFKNRQAVKGIDFKPDMQLEKKPKGIIQKIQTFTEKLKKINVNPYKMVKDPTGKVYGIIPNRDRNGDITSTSLRLLQYP